MTLGKQCQHSKEEGGASWSGVPDLGLSHLTGPVLVLVLLCVSVAWFYYVALTGLRLLILLLQPFDCWLTGVFQCTCLCFVMAYQCSVV